MIRICLNANSQRTKKIEVFCQGTDDSKNVRCETLYIGDYEYVNISSFAVLCIKLWLEEVGDLNSNDPLYSFNWFSWKLKIDTKHLLDETESNIQFIASGQGNIGRSEAEPNIILYGRDQLDAGRGQVQ